MKVALGQGEAQEYQEGLTEVAETLKGTVGLLVSRLSREEVSLIGPPHLWYNFPGCRLPVSHRNVGLSCLKCPGLQGYLCSA